jgi:hypothetical protein
MDETTNAGRIFVGKHLGKGSTWKIEKEMSMWSSGL